MPRIVYQTGTPCACAMAISGPPVTSVRIWQNELLPSDITKLVDALPEAARNFMIESAREKDEVILAGGFIRDVLNNDEWHDVDLYCAKAHKVEDLRIQIIVYSDEPSLLYHMCHTFDFTVCCAAIKFAEDQWFSKCHERFYQDLKERKLRLNQESGSIGSGNKILKRILKMAQYGYSLDGYIADQLYTRLYKDSQDRTDHLTDIGTDHLTDIGFQAELETADGFVETADGFVEDVISERDYYMLNPQIRFT